MEIICEALLDVIFLQRGFNTNSPCLRAGADHLYQVLDLAGSVLDFYVSFALHPNVWNFEVFWRSGLFIRGHLLWGFLNSSFSLPRLIMLFKSQIRFSAFWPLFSALLLSLLILSFLEPSKYLAGKTQERTSISLQYLECSHYSTFKHICFKIFSNFSKRFRLTL